VGRIALVALLAVLLGIGAFARGGFRCPTPFSACDGRSSAPDPGGQAGRGVVIPPPGGRRFGFNTQLYQRTDSQGLSPRDEVAYERAVGAQAQRYTIDWRALQPLPSVPPLSAEQAAPLGQVPDPASNLFKHDAIYLELVKHRMTPIIVLFDAPPWATDYGRCAAGDLRCRSAARSGRLFPNRAHLTQWKDFAAAVAARYPRAVIEPWNEPNLTAFWQPTAPDASHMTQMQCAAYQAVKALPSRNEVVAPGLLVNVRRPQDLSKRYADYMRTMYEHGVTRCMDALSVHTYPNNRLDLGAGSMLASEFRAVRRLRRQFGDRKPIWVTETGSSSFRGALPSQPGLSEAQQASLDTRLYDRLLTMGDVELVLFHTLRNHGFPGQTPAAATRDLEYNFGFLREDLTPKPVYCAFARKAAATVPGCPDGGA